MLDYIAVLLRMLHLALNDYESPKPKQTYNI